MSALALLVAGALLVTRLTPPGPDLTARYESRQAGLRFRYPGGWFVHESPALDLFGTPAPAILLADRPLTPGASYTPAAVAFAIQRIDPTVPFAIPAACQIAAGTGPLATFECMAERGYLVPSYEGFPAVKGAARLRGILPPGPATRPLILLPGRAGDWIAVVVIYWDGFDRARDLLADLAATVQPVA